MSFRRASTQLLAQRSVHLKIIPRPSTIAESREILRMLQRFGPVDLYRHLKYEYNLPMENIALAIYRNADSAQQALNASPIRFALENPIDDAKNPNNDKGNAMDEDGEALQATSQDAKMEVDGIEDLLRPSTLLNNSISETTAPENQSDKRDALSTGASSFPFEPTKKPRTVSKWFSVTVDRSRTVHQDFIDKQPYFLRFTPKKSLAQQDLENKVPHWGLSDVSKRPPHSHYVPYRAVKGARGWAENRMVSPKALWDQTTGRP